jgi:general stress protein YciG
MDQKHPQDEKQPSKPQQQKDDDHSHGPSSNPSQNQDSGGQGHRAKDKPGNFANDPDRARKAGEKAGRS